MICSVFQKVNSESCEKGGLGSDWNRKTNNEQNVGEKQQRVPEGIRSGQQGGELIDTSKVKHGTHDEFL